MTDKTRILVVDDEPSIRITLQAALEDPAHEVVVCDSAAAALDQLRDSSFDVLITDKNMPEMDGIELIRRVREHDEEIGVLMITGYATDETALEALQLGVDDYLEKPFEHIFTVISKVKAVAAKRAKRRPAGSLAPAVSHFSRATAQLHKLRDAAPKGAGMEILVAATDQRRRDRITNLLSDLGHPVVSFEGSDDLRARVGHAQADIAIVDESVASGGLPELFRQIKDISPRTECVAVCPKISLTTVQELMALEAVALLESSLELGGDFHEKIGRMVRQVALRVSTR